MNQSPQDQLERPEDFDVFKRLRPDTRMRESKAPPRHVAATVVDFGGWGDTLRGLKAQIGTGMLVMLTGERTVGKTQMGVELIRAMADRDKASRYTTLTRFLMDVKGTYRRDAAQS